MAAAADKPGLLVVDDDELIVELLLDEFRADYDVIGAGSRPEVAPALRQLGRPPAVALVDLGLPPKPSSPREGLALVKELLAAAPECAVIVISGQSEDDNARLARTYGALDFIAKPCDAAQIKAAIRRVEAAAAAGRGLEGLQGDSAAMARLQRQIGQFGPAPHPVLLEGESGTGKELVARALHRASGLDGAFVAINCAAIPEQLFEAALFGAKRGSYTGAVSDADGHIATAAGGTLFLDEIGDMAPGTQPKLLRALESGEYYRVGDSRPRTADVRVVAATNQPLRDRIAAGSFREDLYHRLSVLAIRTPPLRELGDDRLLLLDGFAAAAARNAAAAPFRLAPEARGLWRRYDFPGNVRELRNVVLRLQVLFPGQEVGPDELAAEFLYRPAAAGGGAAADSLDALLRRDARRHAAAALERAGGSAVKAARRLGISARRLNELLDDDGQKGGGKKGRRTPEA